MEEMEVSGIKTAHFHCQLQCLILNFNRNALQIPFLPLKIHIYLCYPLPLPCKISSSIINLMSDPDVPAAQKHQPETQSPAAAAPTGVSSVLRRWRREDLFRKGSVALRAVALVFSLLSFIIMGSNKHGDWKDFDKYEEYRYVLAIAIMSTLYTGWQSIRARLFTTSSSNQLPASTNSALIDFFGDQIVAYLLLSSASSAVPITNRMREGSDNIFTDSSAAAISMSFLAFFCLGLSALISGYKLSTQSHL